MAITRHIPNAMTLVNLLAGTTAILYLTQQNMEACFLLILIALVADFLDGLLARLLQVQDDLGKQLDSLADMVTFGVLPGFILWQLTFDMSNSWWLACIALVIPCAAAWRLAVFNTSAFKVHGFLGLPTPAMTIAVVGFYYLYQPDMVFGGDFTLPGHPLLPAAVAVLLSILMVVPLPLIALKGKQGMFKPDMYQILLFAGSLILLLLLKMQALLPIILVYILLSCIKSIVK